MVCFRVFRGDPANCRDGESQRSGYRSLISAGRVPVCRPVFLNGDGCFVHWSGTQTTT